MKKTFILAICGIVLWIFGRLLLLGDWLSNAMLDIARYAQYLR